MKKFLVIAIFFSGAALFAQNKNQKTEIEVNGVCLMCKDRIEKAAIKNKGVKSAVWDVNTHKLSVIFDEGKISTEEIEQSVANVGHDTENLTAPKDAYDNLHPCCKYRDEEVIQGH
ncbi:MAG TPA: cation transporter [Flavobacteriaceae bacterium]|nr:cation transporter [Flavobacteriaceae bacterium]